jgi:hemerythrin superfamily protein
MTTGIDLIIADHERMNDLFAEFEQTRDPDLVGRILELLTDHDQAEHATLYPLAQRLLDDQELIERSMVAHSAVKMTIDHLRQLEGEALVTAVGVLQGLVQTHAKDEETNLLPALAERATAAQLDGLGTRFEQAKQRVG